MTSQAHDPSRWPEFYQGRDPAAYKSYAAERYKPFLALIGARLSMDDPDEAVSFELGVGAGTITDILSDVFPRADFFGCDVHPAMLAMTAQRLEAKGHSGYVLFHQDVREPTNNPAFRASVIHSHGLLEHFSDEEAAKVVGHWGDFYQVHYIPGLYPEPSYGDERLLPLDHWVKALRPSRSYTFNEGLDYALVFHPRGYH